MFEQVNSAVSSAEELTKSESSKQKLAEDLDQFMNLLVTQLKHQDPLDPMDPNEFTSQLVQFASVEQQIQSNLHLENMLALEQTSLLGTAVGYIGTQVEVIGNEMPLENGQGRSDYELDESVGTTSINVTDSTGKVVFFTGGETTPGKHTFEWDGKDNFDFPVADGIYTVSISALDADGELVDLIQSVTGTVTGVSMENGIATLDLNGAEYLVEDVLAVRQPIQ
ncbi:MAG: flagellar hook assembly protein FlgD [Rhodospirillales bacterium]|jgi:flagellar basal-body rod modification protein FlgD|nr:flagellar hook assembly protein FlgD [Rhodospirillales bacterium]MBT4039401.1 flagellar hook assembly protein FlgD [Rhodospirillales bacterium]MBT4627163.1 flagellar hook assembly protein FlgD [Rhodospirillales bacterium]MBT5352465.1 flagellar hook assembly protein FlgD [Rhodospirillales bacterium]MBT5519553.1 flagellar hook assembly protein FlgD [Rhodospirillales bacterium]